LNWIAERVKDRHGRRTPNALPQLYSEQRLAIKEAREKRERLIKEHLDAGGRMPETFFERLRRIIDEKRENLRQEGKNPSRVNLTYSHLLIDYL
jgi:vacuolar-type H+-ATPase subunit H